MIEQACIIGSSGGRHTGCHAGAAREPPPGEAVEIRSLQLDERERLRLVLHMHEGCGTEAAARLGINGSL